MKEEVFSLRHISQREWMAVAVVFVLLTATYTPTFLWMIHRWEATDSYYSHGYLVPFVSLWLLWLKRQFLYDWIRSRRSSVDQKGYSWGMGLFVLGILIHIFSGYFRIYFTSGFSLVLVLLGIAVYLYGIEIFRHVWFIVGFLVFMIPAPLVLIARLNLNLKLLATQAALVLMDLTGVLAVQDGSNIILENDTITVGNACSGLRSIISLLALGALYAYLFKGSTKPGEFHLRQAGKQILLFLCSIPVAMIANVLRIYVIGIVANIYGSELATGPVHDVSGYLLFAVAFGLLYLTGRALDLIIRT